MSRGLLFILALLVLSSCAHPKALIDYSMQGGIIWPGPPEEPRIKYLWSLQKIMGAERSLARLIAGDMEYNPTDPRSSDILLSPRGLYVDQKDTLYIADQGAMRVVVINLSNGESFLITKMGRSELISPIGVVVSSDGRIYVSDSELKRVGIYTSKGKFIKEFEGQMKRPTGLAISPFGNIYVVDTWAHKVYIYDLDGKRVGEFGGEGILNYPTFIAIDDGNIYLSDTLNFSVKIFTLKGALIGEFGVIGDSYATFDKIKGIAVDTEGHIYIVDSIKDMIQIYDREGRLLLFFGQEGSYYGDLRLPSGIYIDSKNRIFVSDSLNMRVQAFQFLGGK